MRCSRLGRALLGSLVIAAIVAVSPAVLGAESVVATVPVGINPTAVATNPMTHKAYVANYYGDSVSVIDGVSQSVVATIPMPMTFLAVPNAILVDFLAASPTAYVANFWSDKLAIIDEASLTVTKTVDLAGVHASGPRALALNPSSSPAKLYVANYGADTVGVHDAATGELVKEIPVGQRPRALAVFASAERERVYVANRLGDSVTVIDGKTDEVVATVATGEAPKNIAVHPSTGTAYVTNEAANTVSVIDDSDSVVANVSVGQRPVGLAVDPSAGRVFVANHSSDSVSVIDTATNGVVETLAVGAGPWQVALDAVTGKAFVTCYTSNQLAIIDGSLSVSLLDVGTQPFGVAIDAAFDPPKEYVTNWGDWTVSIIGGSASAMGGAPLLPRAHAAEAVQPVEVTIDEVAQTPSGYSVSGTASDLRAPYVSNVVAVFVKLDGAEEWMRAAIVEGAATPSVTWRAAVGGADPTGRLLQVAVVDQASAAVNCGEVGAASTSGLFGALVSLPVAPSVDDEAPAVSAPEVEPAKVKAGRDLTVRATADDTALGDSAIASMSYRVDDGAWQPMLAEDGAFDSPSETAIATAAALLPAGYHTVTVSATDAAGNAAVSAPTAFRVVGNLPKAQKLER